MNELLIAGQTDVGQRRKDNQDTFICTTIWSEGSALLVVIDGVGGYAGGDRAAAIARESIEHYMAAPNGDPLSMLREAVVFANNQINDQRQQDPKLAQMCCVLTAAVADVPTGKLYFVHVGDTRLYRFRQNTLEKWTSDHSLVGIREDANELTEAEAMQHPRRNEILREVGSAPHRVDDPDFLESGETDFRAGDLLLLCSDGLTDMVTQTQITGALNRPLLPAEQVAGLIALANRQGGNDNITVVLAKNNTQSAERPSGETLTPATRMRTQELPMASIQASNEPGLAAPTRRVPVSVWAIAGMLLVCLMAVIWYQSTQSDRSDPVAVSTANAAPESDSVAALAVNPSRLDSLLQTAYRSAEHRLVLPGDTLRLTQPLVLTDSLQTIIGGNRLTVLVPADTGQSKVALRVMHAGVVTLENLVISGFKMGIETNGAARLQLKQVYFRGVNQPVSANIRQDTFRNTLLTVSLQDQPDQPLPPTPKSLRR